jgi:hypothetical protein
MELEELGSLYITLRTVFTYEIRLSLHRISPAGLIDWVGVGLCVLFFVKIYYMLYLIIADKNRYASYHTSIIGADAV